MLLRNYTVYNSNPGRTWGGRTNPVVWLKGGSLMLFYGDDERKLTSFPDGSRPPHSWILAISAGGLSSHSETNINFSESALLAGGLPTNGSTTITLTADATGGLIVSGSGTAAIAFDVDGTLISIASGSGQADITCSGTALANAMAYLAGNADIELTPSALISAIGYMEGLSTSESEFSVDNLARAVWDALEANHNLAGTMGEKLHNASSAGDPWGTTLPASYPDGSAGQIVGEQLLKLSKLIRGLVA